MLYGGISDERVYPIPEEPLRSINGNLAGNTKGSSVDPSYELCIATLPSNSSNNVSIVNCGIFTSRYLDAAASSPDVMFPALPKALISGILFVKG